MTRPIGTAAELQRRRRRAVELVQQGQSPSAVAHILGVHETPIHRRRRRARAEGGLQARPLPGPRPRPAGGQLQQLQQLLLQGAHQHGWPNDLGTADRVAALIRRHFAIDYHPGHVRQILKQRLRWGSQKPQARAKEQNDKEGERWLADEFDRLARGVFRRKAHLIFLDEAGCLLTPAVRRTLAPRGRAPLLPAWQRHDRISAIRCVTPGPHARQPELYFELLPADLNVRAEDIGAFLRQLRRELPGPWTIVGDRHNIHSRSRLVREWLAGEPGVVGEDLPSCAAALNPGAMARGWLKYGRLANLTPANVAELRDSLQAALEWAAFDRELLAGFFNHAHLGIQL